LTQQSVLATVSQLFVVIRVFVQKPPPTLVEQMLSARLLLLCVNLLSTDYVYSAFMTPKMDDSY